MRRRAILLGSNNAHPPDLEGVDKDIVDIRAFLLSDFGGAWEPSEIMTIARPNTPQLNRILTLLKFECDYAFVAFGGHGAYDGEHGSYVCLAPDDDYPIAQLGHRSVRQTVVVDACRTFARATVFEDLSKRRGKIVFGGRPSPTYRSSCRARFDAAVGTAEEGTMLVHSCTENQAAGDSSLGGAFTQYLLRAGSDWARSVSNSQTAQGTLSLAQAVKIASAETNRTNFPQQPVLSAGRRQFSFPFAVA